MQRFFVSPRTLAAQPVVLRGEQAHQIIRVLRMQPGEAVVLLDNRGAAYDAVLEGTGKDEARFRLTGPSETRGEPATHVTLYQAVLKGERFGWALQKGTEVGVSRFVPLICARNVVDDMRAIEERRDRWERILREAAEQSRRDRIPELAPAQLFQSVVQPIADPVAAVRLIAWEGELATGLRQALADSNLTRGGRIEVFVGPEGGFTDAEIDSARRCGIQPVSLGPRILRAETAGPVAAALILYEVGDLT
jgi:16S rRNA (uracil1498-N3)-methyltransferase